MTAKKTRSLYWPINNTNKVNQIQFRVNAVCVDDESMEWSAPAVSSASSYTASHVVRLLPKWGIYLETTSLEMKPSSVAIHYPDSTWKSMDGLWRKFGPV